MLNQKFRSNKKGVRIGYYYFVYLLDRKMYILQ